MTPQSRAEEWANTREVLIELPYRVSTIRPAIVKEQIAAFLAGEASATARIWCKVNACRTIHDVAALAEELFKLLPKEGAE